MSKYRAVRTECDGIMFHSKKEAADYANFALLLKNGKIANLERQVSFRLFAWAPQPTVVSGVAKYIADFVVTELDGTKRIYDSKGYSTPMYKLKKKIFEANYPHLRIVEI